CPEIDVGKGVLVEWIAGRGMDEQKTCAVKRNGSRQGQRRQEPQVVRSQAFTGQSPRHACQVFNPVTTGNDHVLSDTMIMVAAHRELVALADPLDACDWRQGLIDQSAQAKT